MSEPRNIAARVEQLLGELTLEEKISLLSGRDQWYTVPNERLGIPSIAMTDGPHGVRASNPETGRMIGPTTAFPTGISMGAAWNPDLVEEVGQALGEETRALGCDILLGPCVNIVRHPLGGRNFETYSEDPYHAGRTAVGFIKGVQNSGVGTSLKHFALNNYEIERFRASTRVDERTMREIYLAQFEMAVKESQPWTVMCSYNRINGVYASQNDTLMNKILRDEWGFEGAVISDWGANHTIFESFQAGLDLEMPGPAKYTVLLLDAVNNWQVDEAVIDKAVRRILKLVLLSGRMDDTISKGSVNTVEHQVLARRLAEEAITLLKNEGDVLPLIGIDSLAVIGPNAAEAVIAGGGSSHVQPAYRVSPLEALRTRLSQNVELMYEPGGDNFDNPHTVPQAWLKDGLRRTFFATQDFSADPIHTQEGMGTDFWFHVNWLNSELKPVAGRWTGNLEIPEDGTYRLVMTHAGTVRVCVDGTQVMQAEAQDATWHADKNSSGTIKLQAGKVHELLIEYLRPPYQEVMKFNLGIGQIFPDGEDPRLARAMEAARNCEVAVVFAGYPESYETEGTDRPSMELMGKQDELISAVAASNPRTVVVLNAGAPVAMPWIDQVAAVVLAYYPGQESGNALTAVLLGEVNPSGKLPVTFPARLQDSPAYINNSYPGCREVVYGEGIFVGYRYFDAREISPLFPFGHGLSFTNFEYSNLVISKKGVARAEVEVSLEVKNTGKVTGKEVVQLYIADLITSLPRPPKELKGFSKIELKPGETTTVHFSLNERSFAYFDPIRKNWMAEPGEFKIQAGSSSRDIRLEGIYLLE